MKRRLNLIAGILHSPKILFLDEPTVGIDVQSKNVIIEYLKEEGIPITNQDVGGKLPRKVYFIPSINEVYVKKIRNIHNNTISNREDSYRKVLNQSQDKNVFYL